MSHLLFDLISYRRKSLDYVKSRRYAKREIWPRPIVTVVASSICRCVIVMSSGVLLKMEVGIRKGAWRRA